MRLAPLLAVVLLLVMTSTAAASGQAAPGGRISIVGGTPATVGSVPWQVALLEHNVSDPYQALLCGAIVRDATHVITAAHCVFPPGPGGPTPRAGSYFDVLVGATNLARPLEAGAQRIRGQAVSLPMNPSFDPETLENDVAIITLSAPITTSAAAFAGFADPARGRFWDGVGGDAGTISGWGTDGASFPVGLHAASVPIVSASQCAQRYGAQFHTASMLCAGNLASGGVDACTGDSGGPLTVVDPGYSRPRLVGVTSWGSGCAQAGLPGVYARVDAPHLQTFLRTVSPAPAPVPAGGPAISGAAAVGSTLQCAPPAWSVAPATIDYEFERVVGDTAFSLTTAAGGAAYTVQATDAGGQLRCVVRAESAGGYAELRSALTATIPGQEVRTQSNRDIASPSSRIARASCTRVQCRLTITVSDRLPTAGIKGITTTVSHVERVRCTRLGRRTTCLRKRLRVLVPRRLTSKLYVVTLRRPHLGRYTFSVIAVDRAGNRQARPLTRIMRVR